MPNEIIQTLRELTVQKGRVHFLSGERLFFHLSNDEADFVLAVLPEGNIFGIGFNSRLSEGKAESDIAWDIAQGISGPEAPAVVRQINGENYLSVRIGMTEEELALREALGLGPNNIVGMTGLTFDQKIIGGEDAGSLIASQYLIEDGSAAALQIDFLLNKVRENVI